jgi:WD40 repeat protein
VHDVLSVAIPRTPYRGIQPFLYSDHPIFFARDRETRDLLRRTVVYRGLFLYGESGAGKSSLINAGLIPAAAEEGFRAERIRVQPRRDEEFVVERIPMTSEPDSPFLPSGFAGSDDPPRVVVSTERFHVRLRELTDQVPLLIFDQFEELITLFEEATEGDALREARAVQERVVRLLVDLVQDETLAVKVLFVFREDYLARVRELMARCPELMDHSLRLTPPETLALYDIIRGPFEKYPGHFDAELSPQLALRLATAIEARSAAGALSLSELQVVCLRLWSADDPDALFDQTGVEGLIEDYLWSSLNDFDDLRFPAIALLSQMVTPSGARNVISAEDLIRRVHEEEKIDDELLIRALGVLEDETRLVRRERRRDLFLYEITSEFLVPWIRARQEESVRARERDKLAADEARRVRERRNRAFRISAGALLVLAAVLATVAAIAFKQSRDATNKTRVERSLQLANLAETRASDPARAIQIAALGVDIKQTPRAAGTFAELLARTHIAGLLRPHAGALNAVALSPDGHHVVTGGKDGLTRIWDLDTGEGDVLEGGRLPVRAVAYSADGRRVLSLDKAGSVRVWSTSHRSPVTELRVSGSHARGLYAAFRSGGRSVVTVSRDATTRIWDVAEGKPIYVIPGRLKTSAVSAAIARSSGDVMIAGDDGAVVGVHLPDETVRTVSKSHSRIKDAALSADGKRLATVGEGRVRVWNLLNGRQVGLMVIGRSGPVRHVALSRDGKFLLTALRAGRIRIWNVATRKPVATLRGHKGVVRGADFSVDDKFAVTAGADGSAIVWAVRSDQELASVGQFHGAAFSPDGGSLVAFGTTGARVHAIRHGRAHGDFPGEPQPFTNVALSRDNRLILTTGDDATARIWNVETRVVRAVLHGHTDEITAASFSPNGRFILTASSDNTARVWSTGSARTVAILRGHKDEVTAASFSPDGRLIVTASSDGTARIWHLSGGLVKVLRGHTDSITGASFSPNGRLILTTSWDGTVRIWKVPTGVPVATLRDRGYISDAAFGPRGTTVITAFESGSHIWGIDGRLIATFRSRDYVDTARLIPNSGLAITTGDGTAHIWRAATGKQIQVLHNVDSASLSPDGKLLATADVDGGFRIWSIEAHVHLAFERKGGDGSPVVFSPDSSLAVVAGTGTATILTLSTRKRIGVLHGPPGRVDGATLSADGRLLITRSEGVFRLWDVKHHRSVAVLRSNVTPSADTFSTATFSPNSKLILTTSRRRSASQIWDATTGRPLVEKPALVAFGSRPVFSPDSTLVAAPESQRIRLWNAITGRPVGTLRVRHGYVRTVAFSPRGNLLVGIGGKAARVWSLKTKKPIATLLGHTGYVYDAAFSRDGSRVATAGADGTARVWRVKDGTQLSVTRGHSGYLYDVAFSPDERFLMAMAGDGTVRISDVTTGGTCGILGNAPATLEAAQFFGQGSDLLTVDRDGIVRRERAETCTLLSSSHRLGETAQRFVRGLTDAERREFLATA